MELKRDAGVFTTDGQNVGHVDRVVLDPTTKAITHLVVRKGLLFVQDKVVPLTMVAEATTERVKLREDVHDLQALPDFEETHYIVADEAELMRPPASAGPYLPGLYPYPPLPISEPAYITRVEENIPHGTVALKEGARVFAADGKHVGDIEEVIVNPQTDQATHFVISKGLFLKEKKTVPAAWADLLSENEVHLVVGSARLEDLRPHQN